MGVDKKSSVSLMAVLTSDTLADTAGDDRTLIHDGCHATNKAVRCIVYRYLHFS